MNGRRFILAAIVVIFIVIVTIAIFSIDWGGGNRPIQEALNQPNLSDYSQTDTSVRMTIRGEVNNNQEHQDLVITVGRDLATGEIQNGYQGEISQSQDTPNNSTSYQAFLSALQNAGFNKKQLPPKDVQYDGACAESLRYTFEIINGGQPESSWTTSCSKKMGNFAGDLMAVRNLFYAQIPSAQFKTLTADTDF